MPQRDGTGPLGLGPRTGWGRGYCGRGLGWRRTYGRGWGYGLGRGFGWRALGWQPLSKEEELSELKREEEILKEELEAVRKDIEELEKK